MDEEIQLILYFYRLLHEGLKMSHQVENNNLSNPTCHQIYLICCYDYFFKNLNWRQIPSS